MDTDRVTLYHAVIGEAINVFGESVGAPKCGPDVLGAGDVLVLDCEGAEAGILRGLESEYQAIIVEDHPNQGTKAERLGQHLPSYETQIREYQPDNDEKSVLVATREQ